MRVGMLGVKRLMTALVAAAGVAACSGGGDDGTGPTPTMEIALSQAALSIQQGASGTVNVTLTRGGGFTGPVDIAVTGAPAGVTATAAPASIASGSTSSVITINVGATAAAGTSNLTVRATGTGVTEKTQTLALTITAAPAPSYTLAVTPATVSVQIGAAGTANVALTRTGGFAGAVALTVEGLPNGVTGMFNPASVPGASSTSVLTLNVGAGAAAGTSTVTVKGTATGQADKTATFQLTITAAPAGSYTLAVTPATVSVQQGAAGTANVALTRTGGFTGPVALTAEGLPNGVTASFNPASVTADASVLTLNVGAAAAAGTSTITVKGTATGQADKTATFQLTVTAAPAGGYTLAISPAALTVQQGTSGTTTVNLTRTGGFAGAVTLAATGLPNGVTASFNPAAPTTNTSTLTLTAAGTATLGQATVTITGTATGIANQTTTLALTVTAATGGTGNTTWEFCPADAPVWFAAQDGNGAWTRVTPTGTRFQFNIASGRGGVAYVTSTTSPSTSTARALARRMSAAMETTLLMRNKAIEARASMRYAMRASALADAVNLTIFYGTQAELNATGTAQCPAGGTGKTVNGSVANVGAQQTVSISLGDALASANAATPTFQLTGVPDGALDLVASLSTTNLTTFSSVVDKIIIRRGVNAANNSTLPVLDFNSAEAFAPAQANITVGNLGTDLVALATAFFTSNGTVGATLLSGLPQTGAGPFKYYGVPAARQATGDLHSVVAIALSQAADQARLAATYFKDPIDRTVTLGAALPAPTVSSAATTPYARHRITGSTTAAYNKVVEAIFDQSSAGVPRSVMITATAGYLNNATTYDFTVPDFTGVAGWNNAWGLQAGTATDWTVTAVGFTGIGITNPNPVEGATFTGAVRMGTI